MPKPNKTNIDVSKKGILKADKKEPTTVCNARLPHKEGYCSNSAGFGTDHEGIGRCKEHGGALGSGRPKSFLKPTQFFSDEILKKLEELDSVNPGALANVDSEVTVLRSLLYKYMQACYNSGRLPNPNDLKKYTDCLAKMLEIKAKAEIQPTPKNLTQNVFITYVNQINNILKKHIQDSGLLNRIADDLEGLSIPTESSEDNN
jgi:hypothetical protein